MRVRAVAPADLPRVLSEDWVDHSHRPYLVSEVAYVPVLEGHPCHKEIKKTEQYRGRGFFMLGDIVILHGAAPSANQLQKIISLKRPRGIILIRSVNETTRVPDCEVLYGEAGEVCHRECGYRYLLDPCRIMFSQGNLSEKKRMADLVHSGRGNEMIADMFAGIGYFSIPMAGAGASVHAMEINPVALSYLKRNMAINGLQDHIRPSLGDCRRLLSGTYDRIVMGHFDAITMLPSALQHVRQGSIIHLHSIGSVENEIHTLLAGSGFSGEVHVHKVKKYRPHTWHIVSDIVIT